jgi:hypothetical protein
MPVRFPSKKNTTWWPPSGFEMTWWLPSLQVKEKKNLVAPKWFQSDMVAIRFPSETKKRFKEKKQKI